jgi:hypothetical protein
MIPIEQSTTPSFLEPISDPFSNCNDKPGITRQSLTDRITKVIKSKCRSQVLVCVVSLVYLIGFEKNILVQDVQPTGKVKTLLSMLVWEEVGHED